MDHETRYLGHMNLAMQSLPVRVLRDGAEFRGRIDVRMILVFIILSTLGCSTIPRGPDSPETPSFALERRRTRASVGDSLPHPRAIRTNRAYHIINSGIDGSVTRIQMIDAAERTIDIAVLHLSRRQDGLLIADRAQGVPPTAECACEFLVDDGDTVAGDQKNPSARAIS